MFQPKNIIIAAFLLTAIAVVFSHGSFSRAQSQTSDYQNTYEQKRSRIGLDIYKNIYENFDDLVEKRALGRSLEVLNSLDSEKKHTEEDVKEIIYSGRFDVYQLLKQQSGSHEELKKEIFDRIISNYNFEKEMANYELDLQIRTGSAGQYSNGTTDDSSYDLVVDLNKLDVVFFGEKASLPVAYWGTYDGFLKDTGIRNGNSNISNTNTNATSNTNPNSQNGNRNLNANGNQNQNNNTNRNSSTTNNINRNTNGTTTPNANANTSPLVCAPGSTIQINDQDLNNQLSDLQNQIGQIKDQIDAGNSGVTLDDVNQTNTNRNNAPLSQQDYRTPPERSGGDSGFTSEKDEEGSDGWPCNDFFCIKVSFETGTAKAAYPTYDNSIRAHADYIYQHISDTTQYPLAAKATTREFFSLGFHDLKLADHLHLKVFISSKPVWSPKKYTYTSVNTDAVTQSQQAAEGKADPRGGAINNHIPTSEPTQALGVQNSGRQTQDDLNTKVRQDIALTEDAQKKQKEFELLATQLQTTADLTPLIDEIKMMRNALSSMNTDVLSMLATAHKFSQIQCVGN